MIYGWHHLSARDTYLGCSGSVHDHFTTKTHCRIWYDLTWPRRLRTTRAWGSCRPGCRARDAQHDRAQGVTGQAAAPARRSGAQRRSRPAARRGPAAPARRRRPPTAAARRQAARTPRPRGPAPPAGATPPSPAPGAWKPASILGLPNSQASAIFKVLPQHQRAPQTARSPPTRLLAGGPQG